MGHKNQPKHFLTPMKSCPTDKTHNQNVGCRLNHGLKQAKELSLPPSTMMNWIGCEGGPVPILFLALITTEYLSLGRRPSSN